MADTLIADNRKARFNYRIMETIEAGLVLKGTEVKSCRARKVNLSDGYAAFKGQGLYLQNVHINPYSHGNRENHDPRRLRKILVKKDELRKLIVSWNSGMSIVPLKMYLKGSYVKVLLGLARGKKSHDKRDSIKKRDQNREIARRFRKG